MLRSIVGLGLVLSFSVSSLMPFAQATFAQQPAHPIAAYNFDEGTGERVADITGNHHEGVILGGATWTTGRHGRALLFTGRNSVRIPSSPALGLQAPMSIVAWVRGKAAPFRMETGYRGFRSPYFQVCGDRIYLATTSDEELSYQESSRDGKRVLVPVREGPPTLWTGTVDLNLTNWQYRQQTNPPYGGIEPKLQVVGDRIYYEYFGPDERKQLQIWTAESTLDGSGWRTTRRTEPGGAEQDDNIQVVGDRLYIGFPERDAHKHYHLWTASHKLDGSEFRAVSQIAGGVIPALQVVGDRVYYLFRQYPEAYWSDPTLPYQLLFASAKLDGSDWKVIRKITESHTGGAGNCGAFQIDNGRVYLMYSQLDADPQGKKWGHLYTATMNLDGSNFLARRRTSGQEYVGAAKQGLQIVGQKVYYVFQTLETTQSLKQMADTNSWGEGLMSVWSAESDLDGSNWLVTKRESPEAPIRMLTGYKGIQVVGAKTYMGLMLQQSRKPLREMLGVTGANIVSKGDAYGLGITETGKGRAFVNAGQDYLFRGEAPQDVGGGTADTDIDDNWHKLVMTYDGREIRLYIDGALRTSTPYTSPVGKNPFPLVIGDGFVGIIDDVAIFDRALTPSEVSRAAKD